MEQYEPGTWPPSFCNDLSCPRFTVVETHDEYEVRQYAASRWVTTNMTGVDFDSAQYDLFMRLFNYISGDNIAKAKVNMTCPVIDRIIPGQGPACEDNFTMSFYLPEEAPAPSSDLVYFTDMPSMLVYVRSFSGFSSMPKYLKAAVDLTAALPSGTQYHTSFWYANGYDSPFKLMNRHNEVWFIGK